MPTACIPPFANAYTNRAMRPPHSVSAKARSASWARPRSLERKEAANALADSPRSSRICRHPIPLGSIPPESGIGPLSFADPEFASGATQAVPW